MKCPECVEQGLKSKVFGGTGYVTCLAYKPYYDEDGVFHSHDPNQHTQRMSCSNGHGWTETSQMSCPNCDWGKQK